MTMLHRATESAPPGWFLPGLSPGRLETSNGTEDFDGVEAYAVEVRPVSR